MRAERSGAAPKHHGARPGPPSFVAAYDRYAPVYDRVFGWVLQPGRDLLVRTMQPRPGSRIVEFGVGSGLMLPLYPRDVEVLGLDLSASMLERARARAERLGLQNVKLERIDAEHSHLPGGRFDHVVLPYVYSVTPDPAALIAEAFRVCRAGGTIWILNHFSGLGAWDWLERPLRPFARWVGFRPDFPYSRFVAEMPWQVVDVQPVNLFGLSRLVQVRKPD